MLLITAQPIRNLWTPASADMNKWGFLEQVSPPPLPNPPPLFPFLPILYPLPLSRPATQAMCRGVLSSSAIGVKFEVRVLIMTRKCHLYRFIFLFPFLSLKTLCFPLPASINQGICEQRMFACIYFF